ncbi:MAG: 50S ribosomal protein L20 [Calditrichaeota bacterium]|nr:50S ribosomal protein L20 [Calditrichota bacterium]
MPRSVNHVASHARRNKIRLAARGYYGARSRLLRTMRAAVRRALQYNLAHRRKRAGDFRRLWITRINAACRMHGLSYSKFIHGLALAKIEIDRKMLADLAVRDPNAFSAIAEQARSALT